MPDRRPVRLVLVRGLAREARHWHEFDRQLAGHFVGTPTNSDQFGAAVVERHDLPGNGVLCREPSPRTTASMAASLRARVWASSEQPVVLVAISLGAMVCLEWLQRWPGDPIVGLVAINTSAANLSHAWQRLRWPAWLATARSLMRRDPIARELAILAMTTTDHREDHALARRHAEFQRDRPIRRRNVINQMLAAGQFQIDVLVTAPVLILSSANDRMVDPRCSVELAHRLAANHRIHPRAGHDLTLDDPHWCAAQIRDWLAAISVTSP